MTDAGDGTVKVMEAFCDADGASQRTKDMMQWYADTLTALVSHAEDQIPRATETRHHSETAPTPNSGPNFSGSGSP